MEEPKRPRGRPSTGRQQYKKITLDLKPNDHDYLNYIADLNNSTRRKAIFDALKLLEEKIKK